MMDRAADDATRTLSRIVLRSFVEAMPEMLLWNSGSGRPFRSHATFSPVSLLTAWNFPVVRSSQTTGFRGTGTTWVSSLREHACIDRRQCGVGSRPSGRSAAKDGRCGGALVTARHFSCVCGGTTTLLLWLYSFSLGVGGQRACLPLPPLVGFCSLCRVMDGTVCVWSQAELCVLAVRQSRSAKSRISPTILFSLLLPNTDQPCSAPSLSARAVSPRRRRT